MAGLALLAVLIVAASVAIVLIFVFSSSDTTPEDAETSEPFVKVYVHFVDISGKHTDADMGRRRMLNNQNTQATLGGSASKDNITLFKMAVQEIRVCTHDDKCDYIFGGNFLDEDFNKKKDDRGHYMNWYTDEQYRVFSDFNFQDQSEITQENFNTYVDTIPDFSWIDLKSPNTKKPFVWGRLKPNTEYTSVQIRWFQVIRTKARVALADTTGQSTNVVVHTKPALQSEQYYSDHGFFRNVVKNTDMTSGEAEEMTIFTSGGEWRSSIKFGTPIMTPNTTDNSEVFRLDLAYNIHKTVIDAFQNTERHQANVISEDQNNTQMQVRIPQILPLLYRNDTQKLIRATYKIAIPPLKGAEKFVHKPATPWHIRLDTVYSVGMDQKMISDKDMIYAAYFTLEDNFELWRNGLFKYGQIGRITYLKHYSDGPILANYNGFYSMFDGFIPRYNVGDYGSVNLYGIKSPDYHMQFPCQCDFELPLLSYVRENAMKNIADDESVANLARMFKQFQVTCLRYGGADSSFIPSTSYVVYEENKTVCEPSESSDCCEQTLVHPMPPRNLSYWSYLDSNDKTSYTWQSEQCPYDSRFHLCASCNFDQCQNGKGLVCTKRNFGSMGGGCAPSHKDAWDYRDTQIYTLVEIERLN